MTATLPSNRLVVILLALIGPGSLAFATSASMPNIDTPICAHDSMLLKAMSGNGVCSPQDVGVCFNARHDGILSRLSRQRQNTCAASGQEQGLRFDQTHCTNPTAIDSVSAAPALLGDAGLTAADHNASGSSASTVSLPSSISIIDVSAVPTDLLIMDASPLQPAAMDESMRRASNVTSPSMFAGILVKPGAADFLPGQGLGAFAVAVLAMSVFFSRL